MNCLGLATLVTACVRPAVFLIPPGDKSAAEVERDRKECEERAGPPGVAKPAAYALGGMLGGTVAGAVFLGLASIPNIGSTNDPERIAAVLATGAALGAAVGFVVGAVKGAEAGGEAAREVYLKAYAACMRERGYVVGLDRE